MRIILFLILMSLCLGQDYYHIRLLQAESGQQKALKDKILSDIKLYKKAQNSDAILLQHKQGDLWDYMLIIKIKSPQIEEYIQELSSFRFNYESKINAILAHQIDYIFEGPKHSKFFDLAKTHDLFHIEMFIPIPGKEAELLAEREMETNYLKEVGYNGNDSFIKVFGGEYSIMTIGQYKNFQDFASQEAIPLDKDNEAARKAGFKSVGDIGYYLRSLLSKHVDTITKIVH